jgi:hypothetical protein
METKTKLKVNVQFIEQPQSISFIIFQNESSLIDAIKNGEKPKIEVSLKTKTRVSLGILGGNGRWGINRPSDRFKTHEETTISYATYKEITQNYFVLSKKQNFPALIEYIKDCVANAIGHLIDDEEITVSVYANMDLRYIKTKYK